MISISYNLGTQNYEGWPVGLRPVPYNITKKKSF
ncbi:unnamed protein product, partial [Callosobruchus maculatus]